jgi:ABC-type branched-subunit amino acid transport system substrate-binding protein
MAADKEILLTTKRLKEFIFSVSSVSLWFKFLFMSIFTFMMSACAVVRDEPIVRIALLAPFEGRYREIGYNALYSARLAMQDAGVTSVELLPIDDGGMAESAADRAQALSSDPLIKIAIVLGYAATDVRTQQAFGDIPVLVVGHWGALPQTESIFMLSSCELDEFITTPPRIEVTDAAILDAPIIGDEILALQQFAKLRESLDRITVVSSASLPDKDFAERYRQGDQFAPKPGLLASLTYDATDMAIQAITDVNKTRAGIQRSLGSGTYTGLNGSIAFENGCWRDAPIYQYGYNGDRQLIPVNNIIK